jgi:hypothetical protein
MEGPEMPKNERKAEFAASAAPQLDMGFGANLQRLANAPLKAKVDQRPADFGLFGDLHLQADLVDKLRGTKGEDDGA